MVYRATNDQDQTAAVKRLDGKDNQKLSKITKDLSRLFQLNHQHVVTIFEIKQVDQIIWMVTEFFDKNSLIQECLSVEDPPPTWQ